MLSAQPHRRNRKAEAKGLTGAGLWLVWVEHWSHCPIKRNKTIHQYHPFSKPCQTIPQISMNSPQSNLIYKPSNTSKALKQKWNSSTPPLPKRQKMKTFWVPEMRRSSSSSVESIRKPWRPRRRSSPTSRPSRKGGRGRWWGERVLFFFVFCFYCFIILLHCVFFSIFSSDSWDIFVFAGTFWRSPYSLVVRLQFWVGSLDLQYAKLKQIKKCK